VEKMNEYTESQLRKVVKFLQLNTIDNISISETLNADGISYDPQLIIKVNRPYGSEIITLTLANSPNIKTEYAQKIKITN
jgi:hypothetical protein